MLTRTALFAMSSTLPTPRLRLPSTKSTMDTLLGHSCGRWVARNTRRCCPPTTSQSRSCMIYPEYLIETLTGSQHVRRILVRRYMSFIEKIEKSSKSSLKHLLEKDVRQTTGNNLRSIMEITEKNTIEELNRKSTLLFTKYFKCLK